MRAAWIGAFALTLAIARETVAEPPVMEILSLEAKRQNLLGAGRFEEAIPVNERLIAISETHFGRDHAVTIARVRYLAYLHRSLGDWARAEQLYERAIEANRRVLGEAHIDFETSLRALGDLYREMGDHERAEPIFRDLLARKEANGGPDGAGVPQAMAALAQLYSDMGARDRAEPLLVRALAIVERSQQPAVRVVIAEGHETREDQSEARAEQTSLLVALGRLQLDTGRPSQAEPLFRRAIDLDRRAYKADRLSLAVGLTNLAITRGALGDDAGAEELFAQAIAMRERLFGTDHPRVAFALHDLAVHLLDRGEHARAEPVARRAVAIVEQAHGPDHRRTADVLLDLASARIGLGDVRGAVEAADRAATIQDRDARQILAVGSEAQKRAFIAAHMRSTDAIIALHARRATFDPAATRLALTTVLRRKGRVMDAMVDGLALLRTRLDEEGRTLLDRLARTSSRMAAALRRDGESGAAREEIAMLEAERRALEAEIAQKSADFRADQALVTIDDVERAMPEGSALVEIVAYRPHREERRSRWGSLRYAAYVLRRGRAVGFADLGDARAIDDAVTALRRALADPDLSHDPRPSARALHARIASPIRAFIGDARHVFVSPDGSLSLAPFGALVDDEGRYLVERVEISYITSGRDLLRFASTTRPREPALVVADPAFGAIAGAREAARRSTDGADLGRIAFARLPGSATEARAIGERVVGARVLLGERATEAAIKAAHGPAVLHVATHGFFLGASDVPAPLGGIDRDVAALRAASPLLRSGIALAGANLPARGGEDGILTALEVGALDLFGTRLAVLSACETGVGEPSAWEGVTGMRRALAMAGAETQVMSLWPVDSGATRDLMTRYYDGLTTGRGRSEAMRAAQLAMIADARSKHPNLWAAFIVSGSPRALDGSAPGSLAKVAPGPRGCGCTVASTRDGAAWSAWIVAAIVARRARRRALSCRRHTSSATVACEATARASYEREHDKEAAFPGRVRFL